MYFSFVYRVTDKEVLSGIVGEKVTEHLLQPSYQPALQLLLQAAVFSLVLAAGPTGERHLWLV